MESTTPVYPSAPGPFWLPVLTPEWTPLNVDEPRNEVSCARERRNFSDPPPGRLPSGPLLEVQCLQELGMDFLRRFPTASDDGDSPMSATPDESGSPRSPGHSESYAGEYMRQSLQTSPLDIDLWVGRSTCTLEMFFFTT
jgi:hypothetical protein